MVLAALTTSYIPASVLHVPVRADIAVYKLSSPTLMVPSNTPTGAGLRVDLPAPPHVAPRATRKALGEIDELDEVAEVLSELCDHLVFPGDNHE